MSAEYVLMLTGLGGIGFALDVLAKPVSRPLSRIQGRFGSMRVSLDRANVKLKSGLALWFWAGVGIVVTAVLLASAVPTWQHNAHLWQAEQELRAELKTLDSSLHDKRSLLAAMQTDADTIAWLLCTKYGYRRTGTTEPGKE